VTFTGRFGIGFYSLLYFVKGEGDRIELVTSTGAEARRVTFAREDGVLKTRIDVLDPAAVPRGTAVSLKSAAFNAERAEKVVRESLAFNSNARIRLSTDGGRTVADVNREVFDPENFDQIENENRVQVFYSRAKSVSGITKIYLNVHGVTILTKEISGYGMPETVVFNFPENIGLPISRNRILVNDLFMEKAKDMIRMIGSRPDLLSAFYPLIGILESTAKAAYRGALAAEAREAFAANVSYGTAYLPHSEEFTKIVSDRAVLVDPALLTGVSNSYSSIGRPYYASPEEEAKHEIAKIGEKYVYLVRFSDATKLVATRDAILISEDHVPEIDYDRALYNVLLALNKEGGFKYFDPSQEAAAPEEGLAEEDSTRILGKIQKLLEKTENPSLWAHLEAFLASTVRSLSGEAEPDGLQRKSYFLGDYIEAGLGLLSEMRDDGFYDVLQETGILSMYGDPGDAEYFTSWDGFYIMLHYSYRENKNLLMLLLRDGGFRELARELIREGQQEVLKEVLDRITEAKIDENVSAEAVSLAVGRLRAEPELLRQKGARELLVMGVFLDAESYAKLLENIKANAAELGDSDRRLFNAIEGVSYQQRPTDTSGFGLFIDGGRQAVEEKVINPVESLNERVGSYGVSDAREIATSLRNEPGSIGEALAALESNTDIYSFYLARFYDDPAAVRARFAADFNADLLGRRILASGLSLANKKRFMDALPAQIEEDRGKSFHETKHRFHLIPSLGIELDDAMLEGIVNVGGFLDFLYRMKFVEKDWFLHEKASREMP
jgi:hypothetical protein